MFVRASSRAFVVNNINSARKLQKNIEISIVFEI